MPPFVCFLPFFILLFLLWFSPEWAAKVNEFSQRHPRRIRILLVVVIVLGVALNVYIMFPPRMLAERIPAQMKIEQPKDHHPGQRIVSS